MYLAILIFGSKFILLFIISKISKGTGNLILYSSWWIVIFNVNKSQACYQKSEPEN